MLDVAVASRFPRVYECAGEDPRAAAAHGRAIVQGLQGTPLATAAARRVASVDTPDPDRGGEGAPEDTAARDVAAEAAARHDIPPNLSGPDVVAGCIKHFIACALACVQTQSSSLLCSS